ncbi:hypothetical protein, partial [Neorhizobium galegae]|uniref:hypothetical protein n=1 Tax=Neorhizobium galegae TaxID=399 RepID=UPI0020354EBC
HLCFVKPLKPEFVNRLARMTSPYSTLERLDPGAISADENLRPTARPMPSAPNAQQGSMDQTSKQTS